MIVSRHISVELFIVCVWETKLWIILEIQIFKAYIFHKSKCNLGTDHTLKGYVSIFNSGFLDNWVRDEKSIPNTAAEKIPSLYLCEIALKYLNWADENEHVFIWDWITRRWK